MPCPIQVVATVREGAVDFQFVPHPSEWVLCGLSLHRVETAIKDEIATKFPSPVFAKDTAEQLGACAWHVLEKFYAHGLIRVPGHVKGGGA